MDEQTEPAAEETGGSVDPEIRRGVEAILMVAEDPVHPNLLAQMVGVSPAELERTVSELDEAYAAEGRGFVVAKVAGGYRFQSHPDAAPYVERFVLEGQTARLSSAALETLAIVAYKQPISRAQVAAIRGVSVDGVVRTLEQRGYIAEVARDPGPGNAVLFGTTALFLEKLGLDSVADLPPLAQFVPDARIVEQLEVGLLADRRSAEESNGTGGSDDEGDPDDEPAIAAPSLRGDDGDDDDEGLGPDDPAPEAGSGAPEPAAGADAVDDEDIGTSAADGAPDDGGSDLEGAGGDGPGEP